MTNNTLVTMVKSYSFAAGLVQYVQTVDKRLKLQEKIIRLEEAKDENDPDLIAAKSALAAFDRSEKTVEIMKRKESYDELSVEDKEVINLGAGKIATRLMNDKTFVSDMDKVHAAASDGKLSGNLIRDLVSAMGKVYGVKVKPYSEEGTIAEAYNTMRISGFKVTGKSEPIKIQKRNARNWERTTAIYLYACMVSR